MGDRRCFVQFPHPGEEHKPDGSGHIGWNKTHRNDKPNGHKRKFMEIPGEWMDSDNRLHRDEMWAWGEWEPESRLIRELDRPCGNQDYPRFLWQPYYVARKSYRGLHNTDPFIFGERFLYSNCRQKRKSGLMHLREGSVIAFGSPKMGVGGEWRWWIDTVFVVADSERYRASAATQVLKDRASDVFGIVTGGPLSDNRKTGCAPDEWFRLYRGATPDDPVDRMFSFFPARPKRAGDRAGFPRPEIDLPREYVTPALAMAAKGARRERRPDQLRSIWTNLVAQVQRAGLVLGTCAALPTRDEP